MQLHQKKNAIFHNNTQRAQNNTAEKKMQPEGSFIIIHSKEKFENDAQNKSVKLCTILKRQSTTFHAFWHLYADQSKKL